MPGHEIAHYQIVAKLGAGGMGVVYLAQDARLGRRVALKVLPTEFARDEDRVARFDREARAVAALSHPGIAVLYEIGEAGTCRKNLRLGRSPWTVCSTTPPRSRTHWSTLIVEALTIATSSLPTSW